MKTRHGFVSNSSSTSFYIKNISNVEKTTLDFVKEIGYEMALRYTKDYYPVSGIGLYEENEKKISARDLFVSLKKDCKTSWYFKIFKPGERIELTFGDEDGTIIGRVFDYMLRYGGKSKSFEWHVSSYNR
jgi:hypothetical protein